MIFLLLTFLYDITIVFSSHVLVWHDCCIGKPDENWITGLTLALFLYRSKVLTTFFHCNLMAMTVLPEHHGSSVSGRMKINMTTKLKRAIPLTGKKIILCLIAWFILCTGFYISIHIWESNSRQELIKVGVSISKDISSQSGLPLLEKNIKLLSRIIEKITEKPEVVFASIIDHKNKIIAYTDQKQFFTLNRQKAGVFEDVHYWKISNPNHQKVMNFSSEVTFSGTRVGEVFISLATENIEQLKRSFVFFAVVTLTLILLFFLFGTVKSKDYIPWWKALTTKVRSHKRLLLKDFSDSEISCPLCGNHENFSLNSFQTPDLEKFPVLKQSSGTNNCVLLTDIAKVEELSWLKRVIVVQCTDIINKIVAE